MHKFCNDIDLLKYEPALFKDLARPSQMLSKGIDGSTTGTTFTSATAAFTASGIAAGHVLYIKDSQDQVGSCYEIISVDSDVQLTVSVLRYADDRDLIALPTGADLTYFICSYDLQIAEASQSLLNYFSIGAAETIINPDALRQVCIYAVVSALFAAQASSNENLFYWQKSLYYQKLLNLARNLVKVKIDSNNDSYTDLVINGNTIKLRRN